MPEDKADLAACTVLAFGTWFSYVSVRKFLLQELYSYHGWMYEARKNISIKTKIWAVSFYFLFFLLYIVIKLC